MRSRLRLVTTAALVALVSSIALVCPCPVARADAGHGCCEGSDVPVSLIQASCHEMPVSLRLVFQGPLTPFSPAATTHAAAVRAAMPAAPSRAGAPRLSSHTTSPPVLRI